MKDNLLNLYQIVLDNGKYYQTKENMSHWKVFSDYQFKTKSLLWLIFRIFKLCKAKYNYFSMYIDDYNYIYFDIIKQEYIKLDDDNLYLVEAFQHKETKKIITIIQLQQIKEKQKFIEVIEFITN